ncbi:MAG: 5-formyltetrahydrofolate cyclo-ligase [Marinoscillum sp.]
MSDAKSKIRKGVLFNRRLLSKEVFLQRNEQVISHALTLIKSENISSIHCFLPIQRNHEVDTWPLIKTLVGLDKQVVVSATDFETETMSHFQYADTLVFENDRFGIPTPVSGVSAILSELDAVLIPLLAADKLGNRIGYGKGYYDRMLTEMPLDVLKVGITLGSLFDEFIFVEPHDIGLDYIITPNETVKCN